MSALKITLIGGGSYSWAPQFIRDFAMTPALRNAEICLHDIDPDAVGLVHRVGMRILSAAGSPARLVSTLDRSEALDGADYVLLTITTGGLDAMQADLEIPEKYGIYQSVGDTVGPGGLSRALRSIPVVVSIAREMERRSPDAWLLNYTNPMSTLCRAVTRETGIRTIGLCHEYHGVRRHLAELFAVSPESIRAQVAGINHLTWIRELQVDGADAFPAFGLLAEQILSGEIVVDESDGTSFADHFRVKSLLYQRFGALPAAGDRHIAEFFPDFLTEATGYGTAYGIKRTPVAERRAIREEIRNLLLQLLDGDIPLEPFLAEDSGEAANRIIAAALGGAPYLGPMNLPNEGQIANLPRDVVVETFGLVSQGRVVPEPFGELPPAVLDITRRHVDNQERIVEAALTGSRALALDTLRADPLVPDPGSAPAMLEALLDGNRAYLPLFFRG